MWVGETDVRGFKFLHNFKGDSKAVEKTFHVYPLNKSETLNAVKELKPGKSEDLDNSRSETLKNIAEIHLLIKRSTVSKNF